MTNGVNEFRSVSGLGRWVVTLLAIAVIVDMAAVISGLAERELFTRIAVGSFTNEELDQNDTRMAAIGTAQLALVLVTGIVFIIWFHRAYKNLLAFGAELPHSTGWAIGAWFVPILNLFRPKGIADAIWQASDPQSSTPMGSKWSESEAPLFVHVWWVSWVLSAVAGRVYTAMSRNITTIQDAQNSNTAGLVADGLAVVAGILAILFVKGSTQRQQIKSQQLATLPADASPPVG